MSSDWAEEVLAEAYAKYVHHVEVLLLNKFGSEENIKAAVDRGDLYRIGNEEGESLFCEGEVIARFVILPPQ